MWVMELVKHKECNYSLVQVQDQVVAYERWLWEKINNKIRYQTEHDFKCDYMNYYLTS